MGQSVDRVLLLYHHPLQANAPTIMEHVCAFERYSRFPVIKINTELGFDPAILSHRFSAIVLHYSLFGAWHYMLGEPWYDLLKKHRDACKIAFFQDEFYFCARRFAFLNEFEIDCVFTLYEPQWWDAVYRQHTRVPRLVFTLTGYVSEEAVAAAHKYSLPDAQRTIDIGYRARKLPYHMGRGAQEKWLIAREFLERTAGRGLKLDVSWEEVKRIYGTAWYRFLGNCRATLGVESGVSLIDLDGSIEADCARLIAENPEISFEEISARVLSPHEDVVPLRTISPRCFEAAATRTCQIMFEGHYNGVMTPSVHYIPLAKDFTNFDDVIRRFMDPAARAELTDNAHRDLIASGRYSYRRFVEEFDRCLLESGLQPPARKDSFDAVVRELSGYQRRLHVRARIRSAARFAGFQALARLGALTPRAWRRRLEAWLRRSPQPKPAGDATSSSSTRSVNEA